MTKLLKPLHLNECKCGILNSCKICMAKYQHKYHKKMSPADYELKRMQDREYHARMPPEKREARLKYMRDYAAKDRAAKKAMK